MKKKGLVPKQEQPKQVHVERNDDGAKLSGLSKLRVDLHSLIQEFIDTKGEKMDSSSLDDFEQNSEKINELEFLMTFFNPQLLLFLRNVNNRLILQYESSHKSKSKSSKDKEQIQDSGQEKEAVINGGIQVFGMIVGNVVENLKNKKGNRLIEVDNNTLAHILASNFRLLKGKPINCGSLAIFIGKGRQMESIIDLDVLNELFR